MEKQNTNTTSTPAIGANGAVGGICRALNISDEKQCTAVATSINGLFCAFHSRQCQGLYRGYKSRNARLDRLISTPPPYLSNTKKGLSTYTFKDITSLPLLTEVHSHLFLKLQLLDRVIRARKLHNSRFYAWDMDYGHAKYLDYLQGMRSSTVAALERLERRSAEVVYKDEKWWGWVRGVQDEEGESRKEEKEGKRVRAEAAMFRRHWKAAESRMRDIKRKEEARRQDAYLDMVYRQRMEERRQKGEMEGEDGEDSDMEWDPIEDVLEDNRGSYIDLIQSFLWMAVLEDKVEEPIQAETASPTIPTEEPPTPVEEPQTTTSTPQPIKPSHSSKKAKAKKKKSQTPAKKPESEPPQEPDKSLIESKAEMHLRLTQGVDFESDKIKGMLIAGTLENPVITTKTITFPEDETNRLISEIAEIKHLLFCRLVLSHAALLPAALRASSLEDFLADEEVTASALRDLCLKMENPGLQEIRDACADLFRADEEPEEEDVEMAGNEEEAVEVHPYDKEIFKPKKKKDALPDKWLPKGKQNAKQAAGPMDGMPSLEDLMGAEGGGAVDFGKTRDNAPRKKIRVKICGRSIWNYPSDKAMNRGGWLHFCILAKDSNLHDAVALCRHWDEFFELNILAIWGYFPGKNWAEWAGNRYRQQMLQHGFIMYFETHEPDAMQLTVHHQQGGRRGPSRRSHMAFEARNWICAHIKRDDQASRRLVQYLSMQRHSLLVLVRDAETGNLVIKPPEDERWLFRQKSGLGRAAKNEWNVIKSVGPQFFEEMEKYRGWNFSFKEYYDVYVWDLEPGECFAVLYNTVQEMIFKALRCRKGADMYNLSAPVLKTLHTDKVTNRVRDIKPGEDVTSIYDDINNEKTQFFYGKIEDDTGLKVHRVYDKANVFPRNLFYNQADVLEDAVLFPEELIAGKLNPKDLGKISPLKVWEDEGFSLRKFIEGWESDYSGEDSEADWGTDSEFDDDDDDDDDDGESGDYVLDHELEDGDVLLDDEGDEDEDKEVVPARATGQVPHIDPVEIIKKLNYSKELQEAMAKTMSRPKPKKKDPSDPRVMEEQFMTFLDKEKARIFKEVWHKADTEPHAQTHYIEMLEMSRASRKFNHRNYDNPATVLAFNLLADMEVDATDAKDLHRAIAKISPFFHYHNISKDFFAPDAPGAPFKESLIFNQVERARVYPDVRSHRSNKMQPDVFWEEFDREMCEEGVNGVEDLPADRDLAIRPIIAQLYKSGIIRSRDAHFEGQAIAATEPHRPQTYDFFIDWRQNISTVIMPPSVKNPHLVPPLKTTARKFASRHPAARFSVLTLWSAPYFYPLMVGPQNRDGTSFRDLVGRTYNFMFVPKCMPCSEWSIHRAASLRLEPWMEFFKDRVVVRRDKYLVMGKDEKDLERLTAAVAFVVQMRPWRLEVDLWKSWVNVDVGFLEGLDDKWLV